MPAENRFSTGISPRNSAPCLRQVRSKRISAAAGLRDNPEINKRPIQLRFPRMLCQELC